VDENNLTKFGPGSYKREDGKWMKPPDFVGPDLSYLTEPQPAAFYLSGECRGDATPLECDYVGLKEFIECVIKLIEDEGCDDDFFTLMMTDGSEKVVNLDRSISWTVE